MWYKTATQQQVELLDTIELNKVAVTPSPPPKFTSQFSKLQFCVVYIYLHLHIELCSGRNPWPGSTLLHTGSTYSLHAQTFQARRHLAKSWIKTNNKKKLLQVNPGTRKLEGFVIPSHSFYGNLSSRLQNNIYAKFWLSLPGRCLHSCGPTWLPLKYEGHSIALILSLYIKWLKDLTIWPLLTSNDHWPLHKKQ